MKYLYKCDQIRSIDSKAINELGYPSVLLMENAVFSIVRHTREFLKSGFRGKKALIACGRGNNGGDGLALARHLYTEGAHVIVFLLQSDSPLSEDASVNFEILKNLEKDTDALIIQHEIRELNEIIKINPPDFVFDALLGSGARGTLSEPFTAAVNLLNNLPGVKIAVDIPTGLNGDSGYTDLAFRADLTVSLGGLKTGLFMGSGIAFAGKVVEGSIGVPDTIFDGMVPAAYLTEEADVIKGIPVKTRNINKYSAGRVTVLSGSADYPGAAILTAKALLLSGAGSPFHFVPVKIRNYLVNAVPEVVTVPYEPEQLYDQENRDLFLAHAAKSAAVLIGPGLGRSTEISEFVKKMLHKLAGKKVIADADALYPMYDGRYKNFDLEGFLLTPHEGEFSGLLGIPADEIRRDLIGYGRDFCRETGARLILKGASMIFFDNRGEKITINPTGNSGLAKFGSGDVLSGILASFTAQAGNMESDTVTAAMYVFGAAADSLLQKKGVHGYIASETAEEIPYVIKKLTGN